MSSGWALNAAGWGPGAVVLAALAAVVVALLIHNLRPSRRGTGGPAARSGDANIPGLAAQMHEIAGRMGIAERLLPRIAVPDTHEGDFVYREGSDLVYCGFERGTRMYEHRAADIDELLYRVFRDRAWTQTYVGLIGQDLTPEEHAARLAAGRIELLRKGDPRWADRAAREA